MDVINSFHFCKHVIEVLELPSKRFPAQGRLIVEAVSAQRRVWLAAAAKRSHAIADLPDVIVDAVRKAKVDKLSYTRAKRKEKPILK